VLSFDEIALGPGKADLLALVARTGSIREAAERMNMSYMRAWKLIQTMNACFREPVIVAERGGQGHGGARLSPTGQKALELYREIEQTCVRENKQNWRRLSALLRAR
jgi:molybdate transport system regulatory protein